MLPSGCSNCDILRSKLISRYAMVCNLVHTTGLHLIMDMVVTHFLKYTLLMYRPSVGVGSNLYLHTLELLIPYDL